MKSRALFKCIIPISMCYISIMICADLLVYKFVSMPFGYTTAATLVFPLWFILNDVIAEVYGPKLCWQMIWMGYIVQSFFNLFIYFGIHIASPPGWNLQAYFDLVLGNLFRIELTTVIIFLISIYINIRLLTKWKILMRGKYFWLRSIGSSGIGEAIYSILNIWPMLLGSLALSKLPILIFWSIAIKILYTIILAYPATILVNFLKRVDGDFNDGIDFNPFKQDKNNPLQAEINNGNKFAC